MKVIFFGVVPYSPHFETQLELMEKHLQNGDTVTYLNCDRCLKYCDSNPSGDRLFCLGCHGKRQRGLKQLSRPVRDIKLSSLLAKVDIGNFSPKYDSIESLWELRYKNYDCGEAQLSALFSYTSTIYPDIERYRLDINLALISSVELYCALRRYLKHERFDLGYVYNGRSSTGRAFIRASQDAALEFFTHERGSQVNSYALIRNTVIHNVDYYNQLVLDHWERNADLEEKNKIAAEFFRRLRRGVLTYSEANYLEKQYKDAVPDSWKNRVPRYVFFTSTETEMSALNGFFKKRVYSSLIDTLTRIVNDLAKSNFEGVFLVRMHPNSHREYESLRSRLDPLKKYPFVFIVPPQESVDTYALLDSADKVLTTYSTIGIEAAYSGIPSISLERSFYDLLGSCYTPHSHDETMNLLLNPLQPLSREGAIKYGYYTLTFGEKFNFVTMQGQNKCAFKGKKVRAPRWIDWATKVRRKLS